MKNILTFTLVTLLSFSHLSHAATTSSNAEAKPQIKGTYVIVQSAAHATITPIKDQKNAYLLTLENVGKHSTFFTERPNRTAGIMSTESLAQDWDPKNPQGFAQNPPNGSLVGLHTHLLNRDKTVNVVLQLTKPSYDAKNKTLTYVVHPIGNEKKLASLEKIKLDYATLFIDAFFGGYCASCVINNN